MTLNNGNLTPEEREAKREAKRRLKYLRGELRAERISYGELAELQSLASHIDPSDVELLEAAGVEERPNAKRIAGPEPVRIGVPGYPFTVGRNDCTGEVRYYATLAEAEARITQIEETDPDGVHAGDYYVDGPDELINPKRPEDSKATEFCPVHGEVATVSEDGTDRCPQCGRATSTTPEEAERFEHQDDEHPALPALRGMLAAYAPMAEATAQASGEASLHSAVRAARAAIAHASLPADYRPLYRPTQALEQPPVNTFTAVENALAVMLLNHRIREYLELYDPKAFEQAEAALAAHNPSFPAKLAEARKFRT